MAFTLGIAQTGFPDAGDVLAQVEQVAARARERSVDLLVFPENLMCPRELSATELAALAEPVDGPFANGIRDIARRHDMWIVFTMSETSPAGGPPYNTAAVAGADGRAHGAYRKCHLYDAHSVRESDRMTAGDALCRSIATPFCSIGLGICYDLRFPEVARELALDGCDLLLFPAAWHDGPNKSLHWETLLRARAIENECFVAGVCHGASRYVGESHVFDPLGNELLDGGGDGELQTCSIDLAAIRSARDAMPALAHRRPNLYHLQPGGYP